MVLGALVLGFVVPSTRAFGPPTVVVGFALTLIVGLLVSFRRSRIGPFGPWTQGLAYFTRPLTVRELLALKICAGIAISGAALLLPVFLNGD